MSKDPGFSRSFGPFEVEGGAELRRRRDGRPVGGRWERGFSRSFEGRSYQGKVQGKVRVRSRYGWKFRLGRALVTLMVTMLLLEHYYLPHGIPLVPGVVCQPQTPQVGAGVGQASYLAEQTGNPFGVPMPGQVGKWLWDTSAAAIVGGLSYEAGQVTRRVENGPPPPSRVDATWRGMVRTVGHGLGSFVNGVQGDPPPREKAEPHPGPGSPGGPPLGVPAPMSISDSGCGSCPGQVVPTGSVGDKRGGSKPDIDRAARAAVHEWGRTENAVTAVAIAGGESGWVPDIPNKTSTAKGVWQTMMSIHGVNGTAPQYRPGERWWDVEDNARVAHVLWEQSGWKPWEAYNQGTWTRYLGQARAAVSRVGSSIQTAAAITPAACSGVQSTVAGTVVAPVALSSDRHNYGGSGSHWSHGHTGTDLSVPCGTPVKAATGGTVRIDTTQAWAGNWLVKVETGPRSLTTWYAHMQRLAVTDGQRVSSGQRLGDVVQLGNATGCHLHFEVHPHNGGIYEDGINPSPWLAAHVGKTLGGSSGGVVATSSIAASSRGTQFGLATFNVLGSSHTGKASGARRIVGSTTAVGQQRVDVVGFQEMQPDQAGAFDRLAGGTFARWAPPGDTDNSIAWRRASFEMLSASAVPIPYFNGHTRRMPVVQLSYRPTGDSMWFVNVHNPADTRRFPRQGKWRTAAQTRELALVRRLEQTGDPVFLTGDLNANASAFCQMTAGGDMAAAAGGSHYGRCRPPGYGGIDWIFGRGDTLFLDHQVRRDALVRRSSDHPLVAATVAVGGNVVMGGPVG